MARRRPFRAGLALVLLLSACAGPRVNAPGAPAVRHFESTETAGGGARWHIFIFDPALPRSLDERIDLARAAIARDPACDWIGARRDEIVEQTQAQGAAYGETTLAAPLICRT